MAFQVFAAGSRFWGKANENRRKCHEPETYDMSPPLLPFIHHDLPGWSNLGLGDTPFHNHHSSLQLRGCAR